MPFDGNPGYNFVGKSLAKLVPLMQAADRRQ